ncbi:ABC transporter ATP-binding protein [Gulosibacter molinativorax]|uniref:ABC transporter ATP-binding protein n=1 Tax=Gulosibacter molinativorax TaxID=256821 RepID=A0ABT7C6G8_9MICO|nr:ABC transporter ATP-binding protein [Gulosibacter molinativorax]MDJ1370787.1 ABC transporter ATP-binding protein [Gulosibacter molinativorax]QUY62123.1 ABC transporter ATP-binding protein YtrE [Gulosibacter molinativorax]
MIEIDEASVVVGGVTLLPPVSTSVQRGEALVVRGKNGVGKSTLLRLIAGASSPSSGEVRINGVVVRERDRRFRRHVAAMIGLPPMAPDLTVLDHVSLVATTWLDEPREAVALAHSVIEELGLQELGHRFAHELSSGQTQLFGIALVLARPFEVLVMDEPEQRLDLDRIHTVIKALCSRRDEGATVVVATHSPLVAEKLADRTLLLEVAR